MVFIWPGAAGTRSTPGATLRREAGAGAQGTHGSPGAAISREVGTRAAGTHGAPGGALRQEAGGGAGPEAALSREAGGGAGPGAASSREVGPDTSRPPELPRAGRQAPEQRGHAAAPELPRAGLLLVVSGDFFLVTSYCPTKNSRVLKNAAILQRSRRRRCSYALVVVMVSSSTFSGPVPVLRCPVLFIGTNYHDWVPHMRLHMRGLRL
jgi:hypothetical protein